jgi:dTDP-6-deoxy-L-talose 4-dehydrogenase (NAD+)
MSAGEQLRDYLAIDTAADYLAAVLQQRQFNGVFNCASGQPISVRALVEQRVRERGATIQLNLGHYPYPTHEPLAFWGVAERLQQLTGAEHGA